MHHDPWSFPAADHSNAGGDDPAGALAHPPHTDIPDLSGHADGAQHGMPPNAPITSDPIMVTQIHIGNVSFVQETPVPDHPADAAHHDLVSLAKDTGWLAPTAPPMLFAGALFTGLVGKRLKRLAGVGTDDLGKHLAGGERVVVGVDADALDRAQRGDRLKGLSRIPGQGVERPVEVLSIDDEVTIDEGGPHGRRSMPRESFEAAWERTGRQAFAAPREDPQA